MSKLKFIVLFILSLLGLYLFLAWSSSMDEKRNTAYGAYEHCVEREYGRTVASYVQEMGETPECTPTQADY